MGLIERGDARQNFLDQLARLVQHVFRPRCDGTQYKFVYSGLPKFIEQRHDF